MRVAFTGKGGSGKSTLTSLFALWAQHKVAHVVAIDADLNQHLDYLLKFTERERQNQQSLADHNRALKEILRGQNTKIASIDVMTKTSPPGHGSRFVQVNELRDVLPQCVMAKENLSLLKTGSFTEADLGVSCYHSKTGIVEILLNHLLDTQNDLVVADMTAGVDAFASPLLSRFDLVCLVVEPHPLSMKVYEQFKQYQKHMPFNLCVILNKVKSQADLDRAAKMISDPFIVMPYLDGLSDWLFDEAAPLGVLYESVDKPFSELLHRLSVTPRDWRAYWQTTVELHLKNAESWANESYGTDLSTQVDAEFLQNFSVTTALAA